MTTDDSDLRRALGKKLMIAGAMGIVVGVVIFYVLVIRPSRGLNFDGSTATALIGAITALLVALTGLITAVTGFVKVVRPASKGRQAE